MDQTPNTPPGGAPSTDLLVRRMGHDFNNLLSVILGGLSLLREEVPGEAWSPEARETYEDVVSAAREAADVIARLTAWAGRQAVEPVCADLNAVAREIEPLLARALPAEVRVELTLTDSPVIAWVDRSQLQTVLIELAANARDAMGGCGELRIETCDGVAPEIRVTDGGEGMDAATLAACRDPYFTTRDRAVHRGLGLSVVEGFARASGAELDIESRPGQGTVARLRFARSGAP